MISVQDAATNWPVTALSSTAVALCVSFEQLHDVEPLDAVALLRLLEGARGSTVAVRGNAGPL